MPSHRSTFVRTAIATSLAAAAAVSLLSVTGTTAQAVGTSSVNGPISRDEIIARAQNWVDQAVPYSQSVWHSDSNGSYRQDCSGLVSMAWHLDTSRVTSTLDDVSTPLGSLDDLRPGDMIDNIKTHVVLFTGWTDGSHTTANIIEEPKPGLTARRNTYSRSYLVNNSYLPFRYDRTIDSTPLPPKPAAAAWRAQVLVNGGGSLFHTTRLSDGNWTGFGNVASQAGDIGAIQSIADAGIDGNTHVLAVGGDGGLYHAIRHSDGSWERFANVGQEAGALGNITKISAVSIGGDLHIVAVADGKIFHTARLANGTWMRFADVSGAAGAIGTVTSASAANVNGQLQVVAVSGGRVLHTIRDVSGSWTNWGDVYGAAGDIGSAQDVAITGTGGDMQIIVVTGDGQQYHAARYASGSWQQFNPLAPVIGSFTANRVSAATVDGELQASFITNDDRIMHTIRDGSGSWDPAAALNLSGVSGNHYAVSITGTAG
ncbi:hypothetical protein ACFWIQ_02040 [Kitasatospora sp. NPDC127059]|uniref:hypothetical protein n=1 Tax=unclassified Kitasatospora TaxID=2633591 RepID=UPI00365E949F